MKKILSILFILISLSTYSQITITDINSIGDIVYQRNETPSSLLSVGSSGLNQNWDFSILNSNNSTNTLVFLDPIGTTYEQQYPSASLCLNDNGTLSYYKQESNGLFLLGLGDTVFNSPALFFPLPLTYGLTLSDGPVVIIQESITGPLLSSYIPDSLVSVLTNGVANKAEEALIKITNSTDFVVDASGSMTTGLGSFDVLRLKLTAYTDSELDILCKDTVTNQTTWITNVPFTSIPGLTSFSNNSIEYKYQWVTDDTSVSFLICEAVVDEFDNIIDEVSYQIAPPVSSTVNVEKNLLNVFPNPTSNVLNIDFTKKNNYSLSFVDINGRILISKNVINNISLDISSFNKGIYFLLVKSDEDFVIKKIKIE